MHPTRPGHAADAARESLSALFDGELEGDSARFTLKRMGHEPQWRRTLGAWQLAGDVLRGGGMAAAPRDFAARVSAAVANDGPALQVTHDRRAGRFPRRWAGGAALAASVAMAALFISAPFGNFGGKPANEPATPVAQMATINMTPASALTNPSTPATDPVATQLGVPVELATAVVRDQVPPSAAQRRLRTPGSRLALLASGQDDSPAVVGVAPAASAEPGESVGSGVRAIDPFRAPPAAIVSRPWPRRVLPVYPTTGAMTASYGSRIGVLGTSEPAPQSFYPFEPPRPQATEPDGSPSSAEPP